MGDTTKSGNDKADNLSSSSDCSSENQDKHRIETLEDEEDLSCSEQWRHYPKHVLFIVGMEFCERFSYYGMRSVLLLYLRNYLGFSDDLATAIYHAFTVLAYFTPVIGAIIADSYWGKFKTIWLLSLVYIAGHVVKTIGSIPLIPSPTVHVVLSMVGLVLIACGTGGIKPCVSSFGGDQFAPEQTISRKQFFSLFYLAINAGSLISTFVTPILRADVNCYPNQEGPEFDECYALAFGVPAVLMVVALVLFLSGNKWYIKFPPQGSVFWRFCKCIGSGIKNWWKTPRKERTKEHWLDNSTSEPKMIRDAKYVLRILVIFIPLPFFWALFDQQGSRWTLQAIELDGHLNNIHLKPDQIETLNPIFIVTLIPLFEVTLYPCLRHFKIPFTPLRRMTFGLILAGLSFILAAVLQIQIEAQRTPLPGRGQFGLRIVNDANCQISAASATNDLSFNAMAEPNDVSDFTQNFLNLRDEIVLQYADCNGQLHDATIEKPRAEIVYEVRIGKSDGSMNSIGTIISEKSEDGGGKISFLNGRPGNINISIHLGEPIEIVDLQPGKRSEQVLVDIGNTSFTICDGTMSYPGSIYVEVGAVYSIVFGDDHDIWQVRDLNPNSISVAWIFPQFFVITLGEVFLSVTGLEFSYSQAPPSMKSVVTSFWLLTVSFGNIIVLIITGVQTIESQVGEFFLFAGLIFVAAFFFVILAYFYIPVDEHEFDEEMRLETLHQATLHDKHRGKVKVKPFDNEGFEQDEVTAL